MTTDPTDVVRDAVGEAHTELEVTAHAPVQGEAMHKVVAGHVLDCLDAQGYTIVSKESVSRPSITCPVCGRTSYHPEDVRFGYCSACAWYTSDPFLAQYRPGWVTGEGGG